MNGAHWHLVVNHLPIIFPIVGLLIMITGFLSGSKAVKRTAWMIFVFGAIASAVAMSSGEGAEEVVEGVTANSEQYIERHEESAELFALLSYILGGVSILGLWMSFKEKALANVVAVATLIFAVVVIFFAKSTGTTGGEIRHTEIRSGTNLPTTSGEGSELGDDD